MPPEGKNELSFDRQRQLEAFSRLLDVMDDLREKCPWDKKQTMETLRHLTIEETYELSDAILEGDLQEVKKELKVKAAAKIKIDFFISF